MSVVRASTPTRQRRRTGPRTPPGFATNTLFSDDEDADRSVASEYENQAETFASVLHSRINIATPNTSSSIRHVQTTTELRRVDNDLGILSEDELELGPNETLLYDDDGPIVYERRVHRVLRNTSEDDSASAQTESVGRSPHAFAPRIIDSALLAARYQQERTSLDDVDKALQSLIQARTQAEASAHSQTERPKGHFTICKQIKACVSSNLIMLRDKLARLEAQQTNFTHQQLHVRDALNSQAQIMRQTMMTMAEAQFVNKQKASNASRSAAACPKCPSCPTCPTCPTCPNCPTNAPTKACPETAPAPPSPLVNLASYARGARIIETHCARARSSSWRSRWESLFSMQPDQSARAMLSDSMEPKQCWAFRGAAATALIQLAAPTHVESVALSHVAQAALPASHNQSSAPRRFRVWAAGNSAAPAMPAAHKMLLEADFDPARSPQSFAIPAVHQHEARFIKLEIQSNHGNEYTCVYSFQVNGRATLVA
ncbi:uncharacterized protein MONBRDRAFT_33018 [Monosiga brevicollis MX1]|uniref:SUN domain-containing protein n=1 Tax=Monosiga brevicollis TaxID=81824 RepID=A9V320_MONBE|nr:uncharacterized protein MONBRDRAFT_33018 [Monosiga brevicollis MX1]EDQ87986.1 predicted protein [Monosiga brevicollis MX1]|eukprot:XP_001747062.1 hypothetical protein [Monosiga brevicollis MX1]